MSKYLMIATAVITFILVTPIVAAAQVNDMRRQAGGESGFGKLTGKVLDMDGKPVEGVIVTAQVGREAMETKTGDNGGFHFMRLPAGACRLTFTKEGYKTHQVAARISDTDVNKPMTIKMQEQAGAAAVGDGEPLTQEMISTAVQQAQVGQFREALPVFQRLVEQLPDDTSARLYLGFCLAGLGEFDEAIAIFEQMHQADPENVTVIELLANSYLNNKDVDNAIKYYELTIQKKGDDPEAWFMLGELYNYKQQRELAIEAYDKALELDPTRAEAHLKLGATFDDQGDKEKAIEQLEQYVRMVTSGADLPKARTILATAHFEVAKKLMEELSYEKALEHLNRALEVDPNFEKAEEARKMVEAVQQELNR